MPTHSEKRILQHSAEQMFELVKNIQDYPDFLPWVGAANIQKQNDNEIIAKLSIEFKGLSKGYTSRVSWKQPGMDEKSDEEWAIYVDMVEGPFDHLENRWVFHPLEENKCEVEFFLDFAFKSKLLEKMMGFLFDKAVRKMVSAFESRAKELYD